MESPVLDQWPIQASWAERRAPTTAEAKETTPSKNHTPTMDLAKYTAPGLPLGDAGDKCFVGLIEAPVEEVVAFYNRVFGTRRTVEQFRWKYFSAPISPGVGCFAVDKESGRVVGGNCGVLRYFHVLGQRIPLIESAETAVAEEARGGIKTYRRIVGGTAAQCFARGVPFGYGGQLTEAALRIGRRLFHYNDHLLLITWERRLSLRAGLRKRIGSWSGLAAKLVDPLCARPPRVPHPGDLEFESPRGFGPEFDELWESSKDHYPVIAYRDAAALEWRYRRNPFAEHRIWLARRAGRPAGYLVYREWDQEGVRLATVLDFLCAGDLPLGTALLARACQDAAARGCDFLHFAVAKDSEGEGALRALPGAAPTDRVPPDQVVVSVMPRGPEVAGIEERHFRALVDPAAWYYTQGDSDFRD